NDSEDLGKFQAKADIGIFVGYAPSRKGYRIYNKRTRRLMETIHVTLDEMHQSMAPFKPRSSSNDVCSNQFKPRFSNATKASAGISSGPVPYREERCTLQCALS
ncbi:hypothetical protein Tco_0416604, partial [Tanacetum coccineum]